MKKSESLFQRYSGNPILTKEHWPYEVNAVFNPGAIDVNGQTLLLVRVEDMRGFSHLTLARSTDGFSNWQIDPQPTLVPDPEYNEEQFGIEDPRIVWLEDLGKYAITYVSFSRGGPVVSVALTADFRSFTRLGCLMPPEDKDASLFPRRINNHYILVHRPIIRGEAHIWISFSPDLKYWGEHSILLPVRPGWWDHHRVGLGPPPIETPQGWLLIYHGVRLTASGSLYRVGLALLDLDDPRKVIHRSDHWVFGPEAAYEYIGDVPGVTFPTGVILDTTTKKLRLYYGAADKSVAVATADLDTLLKELKRGR
ncbi:MAG: glycosidase [Calditrichia bacterium]